MLVQCPACKSLVEMSNFSANAGRLSFECSSCKAVQTLQGQDSATPPPPDAATAPIPITKRPETAVTPRPPPAAPPPPMEGAVAPTPSGSPDGKDAALWAAWDKLAGDWTNARAHDQFVAICMGAQALPFAGTRYRFHAEQHPKDPMARRGRDRVMAQAMALATADREERKEQPTARKGPSPKVVLTVVLVLCFGGVVLSATRTIKAMSHAAESAE